MNLVPVVVIVSDFRKELTQAINRCSMENGSGTPDYILAEYLRSCLMAFDTAVNKRNKWHNQDMIRRIQEGVIVQSEIEYSCRSDSVCHCEEDLLIKSNDDKLSSPMMEVC